MGFMFGIWSLAISLLFWSTWLLVRNLNKRKKESTTFSPTTILKPLKGADADLRVNLQSFFELEYPIFELLFSVADRSDPAIGVVRELQKKFPKVSAHIFIGGANAGLNPKVNNLIRSYETACFDLLLISDSNVRVPKNYLQKIVPQMREDIGVLTATVAGSEPQGIGGYLESIYLNTFYARSFHFVASVGRPCVIGKSMMFRKSDAERFGGIKALSNYVAEDYVLGEEMRKLGLRVEIMREPIEQHIGGYSFSAFWSRHVRWGRIRKTQSIFSFIIEPLIGSIVSGLFGAISVNNLFGVPVHYFLAGHFFVWMACDLIVASSVLRKIQKKLTYRYILAWVLRELFALPLWITVAMRNTVNWRGNVLRLRFGGIIIEEEITYATDEASVPLGSGY